MHQTGAGMGAGFHMPGTGMLEMGTGMLKWIR